MTALLDVDQLRTFIAIAETGSFTRAAEVVHKTQSAVSMQMKRLEERIERPIFARDGRASKLTEDGQRLLDYARRIVNLNMETIAAFSDSRPPATASSYSKRDASHVPSISSNVHVCVIPWAPRVITKVYTFTPVYP